MKFCHSLIPQSSSVLDVCVLDGVNMHLNITWAYEVLSLTLHFLESKFQRSGCTAWFEHAFKHMCAIMQFCHSRFLEVPGLLAIALI